MWQLVMLGLAMALNNTFASIALGAANMRRWHQLRTALVFGIFEAIMPVAGMWVGQDLAGFIGDKARYIGVLVLVLAGLYSLFKAAKQDEGEHRAQGFQTVFLAVALSLDNLTVGFGLGMLKLPLGLAALVFGTVSLVMTFVGLEIGRFLGRKVSLSADKLSGIVLLVAAGAMLIR
ncbi:manganese efflux pump MntP family protein [Alicyclobacillus tolerans]|uniref:manganese efflux pump MntP n=1 Tax=Alicyclobacillus tolerans TaxID=90970 RepID=UPI001F42CE55|nr:manganese efflux pump [Alicyclobacillus tolerans]MCF8564960.1 manganese efflux pump MntP family protein [Alicyclobacillus tolerans]